MNASAVGPGANGGPLLLKIGEAVQLLGLGQVAVKALAKAGQVDTVKTPGGQTRYTRASILAYARGERRPAVKVDLRTLRRNAQIAAGILPR